MARTTTTPTRRTSETGRLLERVAALERQVKALLAVVRSLDCPDERMSRALSLARAEFGEG